MFACRWLLAPIYLGLSLWYVVLHLTFVVSAVLLGVLDRIAFAGHRKA